MGTGTAVAKPSPRCIAETEDGRGRQPEETRGDVYSGGRSNRQNPRCHISLNLILIRVIALCPRCIGPGDRLFLVYFDRIGADKTS